MDVCAGDSDDKKGPWTSEDGGPRYTEQYWVSARFRPRSKRHPQRTHAPPHAHGAPLACISRQDSKMALSRRRGARSKTKHLAPIFGTEIQARAPRALAAVRFGAKLALLRRSETEFGPPITQEHACVLRTQTADLTAPQLTQSPFGRPAFPPSGTITTRSLHRERHLG